MATKLRVTRLCDRCGFVGEPGSEVAKYHLTLVGDVVKLALLEVTLRDLEENTYDEYAIIADPASDLFSVDLCGVCVLDVNDVLKPFG